MMRKINKNRSARRERAHGGATCRDTLRLRNIPVSTVRVQLDRGYGHQGDFKGPVQHEAWGQRCSTWRPDCSPIVVQYDSTRADVVLLIPACVLQNGLLVGHV
jgi:hypothetical protein